MKTAIDSYCYHRFFGEVYPQQSKPARSMTLEDFLRRAHELGVGGVSLESCFMPSLDSGYLAQVRGLLDEYNLERVFAWGHPDGLEGGANQDAYREMIRCFESARKHRREGNARGRQQPDVSQPAARAADRAPHAHVPGSRQSG